MTNKNSTAHIGIFVPDSLAPSVERAPIVEELHIDQLESSIEKLRKKIAAEENKITKFKAEVDRLQREYEAMAAPMRMEVRKVVTCLANEVISACSSAEFYAGFKCELRDLLRSTIEQLGMPDVALPEWMEYTPPDPNTKPPKNDASEKGAGGSEHAHDENYEDFGESFFKQAFEAFQREQREQADENARLWRGDRVSMGEQDQRQLRDLYLKLVTATHPDRATSEQDLVEKTTLTSRINTAYRSGQFTTLLDIERELHTKTTLSERIERFQFFKDKIKHLETTKQLLDKQLQGVKSNLKLLKRSDHGKLHTSLKRQMNFMPNIEESLAQFRRESRPIIDLSERISQALAKKTKVGALRAWFNRNFIPDSPFSDSSSDEEHSEDDAQFIEIIENEFEDLFEAVGGNRRRRRRERSKKARRR